jgi:transcriptional regulator with XRE-family HTH domain
MEKIFSEKFKCLRRSAGLSQVAVSNATGLGLNIIKKIETGRQYPTPETLLIVARFFGVSIDYLFGRTNNPAFYPDEDAATLEATAV